MCQGDEHMGYVFKVKCQMYSYGDDAYIHCSTQDEPCTMNAEQRHVERTFVRQRCRMTTDTAATHPDEARTTEGRRLSLPKVGVVRGQMGQILAVTPANRGGDWPMVD